MGMNAGQRCGFRSAPQCGVAPILLVLALAVVLFGAPSAFADEVASGQEGESSPAVSSMIYNGGAADTTWFFQHLDSQTYVISTAAQLNGLAYLTTQDGFYNEDGQLVENASEGQKIVQNPLQGKRIELAGDIDMSGYTWDRPIAFTGRGNGVRHGFGGVFDGQGHTVKNLSGAMGLFGVVENGVVQNVTVELSAACMTNPSQTSSALGGMVSNLVSGGVYDCTVRGNMEFAANWSHDSNRAGGVVGVVTTLAPTTAEDGTTIPAPASRVVGCTFEGTLKANCASVGGIVGKIATSRLSDQVVIDRCANKGSVVLDYAGVTSAYVGGVLGCGSFAGDLRIERCVNMGTVESKQYQYAAGIAASPFGSDQGHEDSIQGVIDRCYNAGTVVSKQYAAGIIGIDRGSGSEECLTVSNCYSYGQLTGRNASRVGGIAVNKNGEVSKTLLNCYYLKETAGSGVIGSADASGSCESFAPSAASDLAGKLGDGFVPDTAEKLNGGFPLLSWQLPNTHYAADVSVTLSSSINDDGNAPTVSVDGTAPVSMEGSAADGYTLHVDNLSQGMHEYVIEKRGYLPISSKLLVSGADQTVSRILEQLNYQVTLAMTPADATVELYDAQGGACVPIAHDEAVGTITYALPNGEYTYRVYAYGYEQVSGRKVKVDYADERVDVELAELPAATLTVDVVSSTGLQFDGNDPVVDLLYEDSPVWCETGSHQEIPAKQGTLTLRVKAANHAVFETTLDVTGDQDVLVSLPLQEAWDGAGRDYTWYSHHLDADEFFIRTPDDLAAFATMVRAGEPFEGKTVSLLGDIDLGGKWWVGIGTASAPFKGEFNGGGHKVVGLNIDGLTPRNEETETEAQALDRKQTSGLFDCVQSGSVKNLEVNGSVVTDTGNSETRNGVGLVVGNASGSVIENCTVNGAIEASGTSVCSVGMVCGLGRDQTTIALCESKGSINVAAGNGTGIGGIVGDGKGLASINDCGSSTGIVYERTTSWGNSYCGAGGIMGTSGIDSFIISHCENKGSISANVGGIGGIVGYVPLSTGSEVAIESCLNTGNVTFTSSPLSRTEPVAGIVGISGGSSAAKSLTLRACANRGNVSASASGDSSVSAAGVLGDYGNVPVVLEACYNTGNVSNSGKSGNAAGIVTGGETKAKLVSCYSAGNVTATAESVKPCGISSAAFANVDASHCFYREGSASQAFGTDFGSSPVLGSRTEMQMKAAAFVELLNRGVDLFKEDVQFDNDGYPVLGMSRSKYLLYSDVEFDKSTTYTGSPINPIKKVKGADGEALAENVDYSLKFMRGDNEIALDESVDASSTYKVMVEGVGNYRGSVTISYYILPKDLEASMFDEIEQVPYSGVEVDPTKLVRSDTLEEGTDYTVAAVSGSDLLSVGDQTLSVKGKGNYAGEIELSFRIVSGGLTIDAVPDVEFSNATPKLQVSVRDAEGNLLAPGTDYELSYEDAEGHELALSDIKVRGVYAVKAAGKGNYGGEVRAKFSVVQGSFAVDDVLEVIATGKSVAPELVVRNVLNSAELLSAGTADRQPDYVLTYKNEKGDKINADQVKDPGTYRVEVKGAGRDYRSDCKVEKTFKVVSANFRVAAVDAMNYTGEKLTPLIRATALEPDEHGDEIVLAEGRDYTVTYKQDGKEIAVDDIVEEGEYQAVIKGAGSYYGEFERSVVVLPGAISLDEVQGLVYSGAAQSPSLTVRNVRGEQLTQGKDFSVEYFRDGIAVAFSQVVSAGSYEVVVTGCGHYAGEVTASFEVAKASLSVRDIPSVTYNAGTQVPAVEACAGESKLPRGRYAITYYQGEDIIAPRDLVNAGTYGIVVVPVAGTEENYVDDAREARTDYVIEKADAAVSASSMHYYNEDMVPKVTVKVGGVALDPSLYEVKTSSDGSTWLPTVRQAGKYQVAVTMKDPRNFTASVNYGTMEVQKAKVSAVVPSYANYTGSPITPGIEVYYWGKRADGTYKKVDPSEYAVSYETVDGKAIDPSEVVTVGEYRVLLTFNPDNYEERVVSETFKIGAPKNASDGGASSGVGYIPTGGTGRLGKVSGFVGREATRGSESGAADSSPDLTNAVSIADAAAAYEAAAGAAAEGKYDSTSAQARQAGDGEADTLAASNEGDPVAAVGEAIDRMPAWLKVALATALIVVVCAGLCAYDYRKAKRLAREVQSLR